MSDVIPFQLGKRIDDVTLLSRSSLLGHLGMGDLGTLLDSLDQLVLPAEACIYRQDEEGEHMYFVLQGDVRLRRGSMETARLGPGDHFGEVAVLGVRRRSATAHAATIVRLARLSRSRFLSLGTNHPRVALHLAEALGASLAATLTAMTDDVGLLLQQRTLPRRSTIRVMVRGVLVDAPMGALVATLLPPSVDGALVVAATVDQKPVSLETPVTSDARVEPLTLASWEGRRIYSSTLGLVLLEAARLVAPEQKVRLGPRRGEARIVTLRSGVDVELVAALERRMHDLVEAGLPLREELWTVDEARVRLSEQGWTDAAELLPFERDKTVSLVTCGGTFALALGPVMPNSRSLRGFSLSVAGEEVLLDFGELIRRHASTQSSVANRTPHAATTAAATERDAMARELEKWRDTLAVTSVGAFNRSCVTGQVAELVRVSEGFHEKHIGRIADAIATRRPRIAAIAGPSSSGKTTFIKRLKVQLEVNGIVPVHVSLDDYYFDRERTPRDETGEYDFEAPEAVDIALFQDHAARLLAGERVRTARYDFLTGKSVPGGGAEVTVGVNCVLLVEGIHALNPLFTSPIVEPEAVYRVFVHPATVLPFDRLSSVLSEDIRLIRRIVRDRHQRGYSASASIRRWPSVRRGEERHVNPCLGLADVVFDSGLVYELAVLKGYAQRYLLEVTDDDPAYVTAYRLRQLIDRFVPIEAAHVPPTSIVREFIGGSSFDA